MRSILRAAATAALALFGGAVAQAGDWYVDAVHGDDANDGGSAASAWRTLTHALQAIPTTPPEAHTVHVAPGVYDPALGELFPLRPPPRVRLVGTMGSAHTILRGAPEALLAWSSTGGPDHDATSGAEGLTLRDCGFGLVVYAQDAAVQPSFRDLRVEGAGVAGLSVTADADMSPTQAGAVLESVELVGCGLGIDADASASSLAGGGVRVELRDGVVRDSVGDGIRARALGGMTLLLERCRVVGNGEDGVDSVVLGPMSACLVDARASLFAGNAGCGLRGEAWLTSSFSADWLTGCTVAGNGLAGVRGLFAHQLELRGSIVAGNADDLDLGQPVQAWYSDVQDGDVLGQPGCIAADPLFVEPALGDLRLRFGSPCVDAGDPQAAGEGDLAGRARDVDGDLDTLAAPDMGALELETLALTGSARIGEPLRIELPGPPGASARLFLTRAPLVAPLPTPFGELRLARDELFVAATLGIGAQPAVLVRTLPHDPALVGTSLAFQALTSSPAAPAGAALSNAAEIVVLP